MMLVTGSNGFIGANLVQKLLELRYIPWGVDRVGETDLSLDVASPEFLKYFQGHKFDYIFHFGSPCSILQFKKDPRSCVDNTLSGFRNVLKLAKSSGAKLIYASSGNVYGSKETPHFETDRVNPVNLYGICKSWCENMAQDLNVETLGLRIFCGYGAGEEKKGYLGSVVYQFLKEMRMGRAPVIWGDGSQKRDFIYITDIVEGIIRSMKVNSGVKVLNLASGSSHSYLEVVKVINRVLGSDLEPIFQEKPEGYVESTFADVKLMKQVLKLNPLDLRSGIEEFEDWLRIMMK